MREAYKKGSKTKSQSKGSKKEKNNLKNITNQEKNS